MPPAGTHPSSSDPAPRGMQPSRSPLPELKLRKPMQRARIPAPFINPDPPSAAVPDPVDVDTLVPTHDERGRLIPEWKRQVMVRRLRARLADEVEVCEQEPGAWRFSPSHEAVLGPFGELLTGGGPAAAGVGGGEPEAAAAWRGLPGRAAAPGAGAARPPALPTAQHHRPQPPALPRGSPCPSGAAAWLAWWAAWLRCWPTPRGLAPPPVPTPLPAAPLPAAPRTPAGSLAQREIRQCGVNVRSLRGAFERHGGGSAGKSEPGAVEAASDSGISCEEALSDGSGSPVPESSGLRKERIVLLFLSHWKRSAAAPNPWATACRALQAQRDAGGCSRGRGGLSRVGRLSRQRSAIQQLLGSWRDAAAHPPPPPPAGGPRAPLSPEQFVRRADGTPADYDSLTLELFMLGYFRILEQDLAPEERRGRHLLCFEVFDHLGRHGWEAARAFHRAVTDEIAAGRRSWKDSFEDIKARYFGTTKGSAWLPGMARGSPPQPGARRPAMGHSSEEICRCIDRSFAFWKEKEAEIFSFEE
nr:LOW QUALITY PROTEIN: espin-like protein [Anas platyrhynchos]